MANLNVVSLKTAILFGGVWALKASICTVDNLKNVEKIVDSSWSSLGLVSCSTPTNVCKVCSFLGKEDVLFLFTLRCTH